MQRTIDGITYIIDIEKNEAAVKKAKKGITDANILPMVEYKPVKKINKAAFKGQEELTNVTIPNTVKEIGSYAFYGCSNLNSVDIPDSVTEIGDYAFYGCRNLTSIILPNSITKIGSKVFEFCSALTSITIPDSVTEIGDDAFYGCSNIKHVWFNSNLVNRPDADEIFSQMFKAGLKTREVLLRIPSKN